MGNFTDELKELLELRRNATDAEERAIIDKAINKLIDNMPIGGGITIVPPASPFDGAKTPWWTNPLYQPYCLCVNGQQPKQ